MKITVHGGTDMARALESWPVPEACDELTIDAPQARRFTNCLLNSPINCRVTVVPTENDAVSYAGLFAGCPVERAGSFHRNVWRSCGAATYTLHPGICVTLRAATRLSLL